MATAAKKRLSAEERMEDVVMAAISLSGRLGVDRVTTEGMAEEVGLTQGAIFRHFPTKNDVWVSVIGWIKKAIGQMLDLAEEGEADPLRAVEKMFFAHIRFVQKHPGIPRVVFSEHLLAGKPVFRRLIGEMVDGYEKRIVAKITAAKKMGLAHSAVNPKSAAVLYIAMVQGIVIRTTIFKDGSPLDDLARQVFPLFKMSLTAGDKKP
jgi:AcrR family transcriptional regulator